MIIFDTETTGLVQEGLGLSKQPEIIEFGAIKLDDETMEEVGRLEFLCKPEKLLPEIITKITGLTDADLADCKPFAAYYQDLVDFFIGEREMVAHNVEFDMKLLSYNLRRIGKHFQFPWAPDHICTVQASYSIKGRRLKLMYLYEELFKESFEDAHRAMADTEALTRCVIEMRKRGML